MNCRIRAIDQTIPGGWLYEQTGYKPRKFGPHPIVEPLASEMSSYRTANNLPRATHDECVTDASYFNGTRLGCDPRWTIQGDADYPDQPRRIEEPDWKRPKGCKGCGAKVK